MRPKKLILFALLAGLVTTIIFYFFINRLGPTEPAETEVQETLIEVVAASEPIQENQEITENVITMKEVPESQLHPNAVRDPETVLGRFTSAYIEQDEILLEHHIKQEEETAFISERITEGMRAVSIGVDYVSSVSNLIEPGDYVDVIVSRPSGVDESLFTSEVLLQAVRILSVGERTTETTINEDGEEVTEEYQSVTLELTPENTVTVVNASETGSLQLALHSKRNVDEEDRAASSGKPEEPIVESTIISAPEEEGTSGSGSEETPLEENNEEPQDNSVEEGAGTAGDSMYFAPYTYKANIRAKPNLTAEILTVVDGGTSLYYTNELAMDEDDRSWLQVEFGRGSRGWISSRIIQLEEQAED